MRLGEPTPLVNAGNAIHQAQLAVRRDGTLDVVWRQAGTNQLRHATSADGAKTFTKPADIAGAAGQFPSLAGDAVAWADQGKVSAAVRGANGWSAANPVVDAKLALPAVAAMPAGVWVLAYRRETSPTRLAVVVHRSTDKGVTWAEHAVLATRTGRVAVPGDYIGLAATGDTLFAAYVLPGEAADGPKSRLYVSRVDGRVPDRGK